MVWEPIQEACSAACRRLERAQTAVEELVGDLAPLVLVVLLLVIDAAFSVVAMVGA